MIKRDDIMWLAGLLEGEAWFGLNKRKSGKYPVIALSMCDEDIVVRVSDMWDTNVYRSRNAYVTRITGARAVGWMMTLYTLLGKRRGSAVADAVKVWRDHHHTHAVNGMRLMATCHPDQVAYSLGLCQSCYNRQWKEKRLLKMAG